MAWHSNRRDTASDCPHMHTKPAGRGDLVARILSCADALSDPFSEGTAKDQASPPLALFLQFRFTKVRFPRA